MQQKGALHVRPSLPEVVNFDKPLPRYNYVPREHYLVEHSVGGDTLLGGLNSFDTVYASLPRDSLLPLKKDFRKEKNQERIRKTVRRPETLSCLHSENSDNYFYSTIDTLTKPTKPQLHFSVNYNTINAKKKVQAMSCLVKQNNTRCGIVP